MKRIALALAAAALRAGCTTPGTGWSRAPDLSVYEAMASYADIAREQAVLCDGSRPGRVEAGLGRGFRRARGGGAGRHGVALRR